MKERIAHLKRELLTRRIRYWASFIGMIAMWALAVLSWGFIIVLPDGFDVTGFVEVLATAVFVLVVRLYTRTQTFSQQRAHITIIKLNLQSLKLWESKA